MDRNIDGGGSRSVTYDMMMELIFKIVAVAVVGLVFLLSD